MIMYAGQSCATPAGVTPHRQCAVLKTARTHTTLQTLNILYIKIFYLQDMSLNKTLLVINFLKQTDLLCHQEASD